MKISDAIVIRHRCGHRGKMKSRIIIVGFGFMGRMHARVCQALVARGLDVEIVGIVDPQAESDQAMTELGIRAPRFKSLPEALGRTDASVIDICLPTDLHAVHIQMAARAGKHIFCEKPLALNAKEAEAAVAEAERANVFLQVGQCIRFWPEYEALRQFIQAGDAGKLRRLSLVRRASRPAYSRDNWLHEPSRSKGAALDLHIHDTDFVLHLLGTPRAVDSVGSRQDGAWTYLATHYSYDDVAVTAEGGWDLPAGWGFQMAFQAVFERAVIDYDSGQSPTLRIVRGAEPAQPLAFAKPEVVASGDAGGNISDLGGYYNELAYFYEGLAAGRGPKIATGRQALESLRVVLAEIESAEKQSPVAL
jgi:predicted dehydrogenase